MTPQEAFSTPLSKLLQLMHCAVVAAGTDTVWRNLAPSDETARAAALLRKLAKTTEN